MNAPPTSFLILLSSLCIPTPLWPQARIAPQPDIDVLAYYVQIALDDSLQHIRARTQITLTLQNPKDTLILDFVSFSDTNGLAIDSIHATYGSGFFRMKWWSVSHKLYIFNAGEQPLQDTVRLDIYYHGMPQDGLILSKNRHGQPTAFGDNWPNRASQWFPCHDHPVDKALFTFDIEAPNWTQTISNGRLIARINTTPTRVRTIWKASYPLPTKVAVIGVAPFAVRWDTSIHGIPVSYWIFTPDREKGWKDYAYAPRVLHYFIQLIGPYPFDKLANVQSRTRYGGMENASCIFYAENSVTGRADHEPLIVHEIAHQWFGNAVTEKRWSDLWLSEGMATYLTNLYIEDHYGSDALKKRLRTQRQKVLRYHRRDRRPIVDTLYDRVERLLTPHVYERAAWVLHMLRLQTGRDTFIDILRDFYRQYRFQNAGTKEFFQLVSDHTGRDWAAFVEQWLKHKEIPILHYHYDRQTSTLVIRQAQQGPPLIFPLRLRVHLADGSFQDLHVQIKEHQTLLALPFDGIEAVVIDPEVELLAEYVKI